MVKQGRHFWGDGVINEEFEECDDGNLEIGDYCTNFCKHAAVCGDGIIGIPAVEGSDQPFWYEDCDDGDTITNYCAYGERQCEVCGEAYDFGLSYEWNWYGCNLRQGKTTYCGDGIVDAANGEACDDGDYFNSNDWRRVPTCNADRSAVGAHCGDGIVQFPETCDDPTDDTCNAWCQRGPDGMIEIPAGEFFMGCNEDTYEECYETVFDDGTLYRDCWTQNVDPGCAGSSGATEKLSRLVTLDAFYMDELEISAEEYESCVNAGGCTFGGEAFASNSGWGAYRSRFQSPYTNLSMNFLSWSEAQEYCTWAGKRLPTEAEWEKAARGTDKRIYPWGKRAPSMQVHNLENDSIDRDRCPTTVLFGEPGHDPLRLPRGLRPAGSSPYGIQDMGGGVMEWTFDYYGGYDAEDTLNPLGPQEMAIVSCTSSSGGSLGPVESSPIDDSAYECIPSYVTRGPGGPLVSIEPRVSASSGGGAIAWSLMVIEIG